MQSHASPLSADEIGAIISAHVALEGPLLPILHALQDACGHIPTDARPLICEALNITAAELHGVISFYHDFREAPAGRHVLKICRAEACQSMGGTETAEALLKRLGIGWHGTTANGAVTVEPIYCLGLCACAPAAMIGDKVLGRVDAAKLVRVVAEVSA